MNTGDRLRSERERLGLNQTEFGQLGGVKKLAQINYEKGDRQPDAAYLAAIAAAGADVLYILTGSRPYPTQTQSMHAGLGVAEPPPAAPAGLSQDVREAIRMVADELHAQHKHPDGAQFVALVERALRYITQGRALEKAAQARARPKVRP